MGDELVSVWPNGFGRAAYEGKPFPNGGVDIQNAGHFEIPVEGQVVVIPELRRIRQL